MTKLSDALKIDAREKWEDFLQSCENRRLRLPKSFDDLGVAERVFAFSDFISRNCIRNPDMLLGLVQSNDLASRYDNDDYRGRFAAVKAGIEDEDLFCKVVRRFRCREMVRIAWRDLTGVADLEETMADLSTLAEVLIDESLEWLYHRQCETMGVPFGDNGERQSLVVIGMGKLGAGELNFSSDVDLVFAYPHFGRTEGSENPVSTDEFFTRLCRRLIRVIGATTADGFVFRVDTRLRPDGENGPLVMSFYGMENYYESHGREWERYAWIKARPVAGDIDAGHRLLKRLHPFIYRRYIDFGTFESLRQMKQTIAMEVRRKGLRDNIKLGAGGIREIEFFGQIFQLLRGGVFPALQERRIETVLRILEGEGLIAGETAEALIRAYRFLRAAEHRLQMYADQQTHMLPTDSTGRERLAFSMGFDNWSDFQEPLDRHRLLVHGYFNEILETGEPGKRPLEADRLSENLARVWLDLADEGEVDDILVSAGFDPPSEAVRLLSHLRGHTRTRDMSKEGRKRLDRLMPKVLNAVGRTDESGLVLDRMLDLIQSIQRRTTYLALLLENPGVLRHLVRLSAASPWIAAFLARYPALLDELLDVRTLYAPPKRPELERELADRLNRLEEPDQEYQLIELCLFKQSNVLRVSAADITDVLPIMRVSDHLSDIAETVIGNVLELSWNHLVTKHGHPDCRLDEEPCGQGFAVVAYGKLGGLELGYKSDLDLVFLHAGAGGTTRGGKQPIDITTFFARLGQRVLHMLTARTPLGFLYEADMRLRPSGSSGLLVSHVEAFEDYQKNNAWTWEHQALIRARPIGGDPRLADRFQGIRSRILGMNRDPERLSEEVRDMRERMRKEKEGREKNLFDIKQGQGGLVDIEFLVQNLVLRHASQYPPLLKWTDNVRIIRTLAACGVIDFDTASYLRKAYLVYRSKLHRLNLQEKPPLVEESLFRDLRQGVQEAWDRFLS